MDVYSLLFEGKNAKRLGNIGRQTCNPNDVALLRQS